MKNSERTHSKQNKTTIAEDIQLYIQITINIISYPIKFNPFSPKTLKKR